MANPLRDPQPLRPRRAPLPFPLNIWQSAVGTKWVMALTGIGLLGFVVAHMIGNFHVYEGPAELHEYAEALRDLGGSIIPRTWLLWVLRLGLIAMFVLHIFAAWKTTRLSLTSTDEYPGGRDYVAADYASRTMRWTGVIILAFLLFHLADLTWGLLPHTDYVRGDPYHNLSTSLANAPVAALYVIANVALALHVYHGAWSMFQSLGINNPRYNQARRAFAAGLAAVLLVGNLSFPILAQAGVIDDDSNPCAQYDTTEENTECFEAILSGEGA